MAHFIRREEVEDLLIFPQNLHGVLEEFGVTNRELILPAGTLHHLSEGFETLHDQLEIAIGNLE
jgi:hypothetical protein